MSVEETPRGLPTGEIHRTVIRGNFVDDSAETYIISDNSEFTAEVPELRCTVEQQLPDGTLDITDSAVNTMVIGSSGTTIDKEGMKAELKITDTTYDPGVCAPESDRPPERGHRNMREQNTGGSVVVNAVVGSTGTDINMDGAVIKVKRRNKKGQRPPPKAGQINFTNSAAVNMVVYSSDTNVSMKDADIDIK